MPNNKYLVILVTALNPSNQQITAFGEKRLLQYVAGLERVAELAVKFPVFDYALVDNTITPEWQMPEVIKTVLAKIPNLKTVLFYDNELGAKNKGSGVIVDLKKLAANINILDYEYCIYYEPRQLLQDFKFFELFLQKPANYVKFQSYRVTASTRSKFIQWVLKIIPIYKKQIVIGLSSTESALFKDYLAKTDEKQMAEKKISMEDNFYEFLKDKPIMPLESLGIVWHDAKNDKYITF